MSLKIIVGIITAVVVGGGVVAYTQLHSTDLSQPYMTEQTAEPTAAEVTEQNSLVDGSLRDLLFGASVQCTFTSDVDGVTSNGIFWHADGKYRVEATSHMDDTVYTTNIINDTESIYIWSQTPQGPVAMQMSAEDNPVGVDGMTTESDAQSFDLDESVNYECDPWSANAAQFVPPVDQSFMNLEAMFENLPTLPEGFEFNGVPNRI